MSSLLSLADARFGSLTTFRRSGERVSTPVWVGRDGGALVVLTLAASGKVRRLRRDPRVAGTTRSSPASSWAPSGWSNTSTGDPAPSGSPS